MEVLILFSSYIAVIFLGRDIDIRVNQHIHNIHYKTHLIYWMWFIPVLNVLMPLLFYIDYEISTRKQDVKHNKFINWFFVGCNYRSKNEIKASKEFEDLFNKSPYKNEEEFNDHLNHIKR